MNKFDPNNKVDQETLDRYNSYLATRKSIASNKPCVELRVKQDHEHVYCTEIMFNSKYIDMLGYDFDEYRDLVLREGIPPAQVSDPNAGDDYRKFYEITMRDFAGLFKRNMEFPPMKAQFVTKNKSVPYMLLNKLTIL